MQNERAIVKQKSYIIIDVGGSFLKSAVLNEDGYVHDLSYFITKSYAGNESKEKIIRAFEECITHGLLFIGEKGMEMGGTGIAIPGPFDYHNGLSLMTHKFQSLYGLNLKDLIVEVTSVNPGLPVVFVHDANAVLYGEQWLGYAKDFANTAVVTIGTGLGFAHSQNGTVQCNDWGSPLITIFKTPYGQGILEDYVSKRGILTIYDDMAEKGTAGNLKVIDIANLADKGDRAALATFREVGHILSGVLAGTIAEKNIECLLFAGQISRSFRHMEAAVREGLKNVGGLKQISPVKSIDYAAFYGVLRNINY